MTKWPTCPRLLQREAHGEQSITFVTGIRAILLIVAGLYCPCVPHQAGQGEAAGHVERRHRDCLGFVKKQVPESVSGKL